MSVEHCWVFFLKSKINALIWIVYMYHLKHIASVASIFLAGDIFLKFTYIKLNYNGLGPLHFSWEYIRYVIGRLKLKVKKYYVPPPPPPHTHTHGLGFSRFRDSRNVLFLCLSRFSGWGCPIPALSKTMLRTCLFAG